MEKTVLPIVVGRRVKIFCFEKTHINETLKKIEKSARKSHATVSFRDASILSQMLCPSGLEEKGEVWVTP